MAVPKGVNEYNPSMGTFNANIKRYIDAQIGGMSPAAPVANAVTAPSAAYVQAEAVAVVTKLNELITSLRSAGIIRT